MNLLENYWTKHGKQERNLIVFIDNHKSKCRHATSYLNEYIFGITPEETNSKKSRKSKKKSKKKKKISKKKKKSSILKNELLQKIPDEDLVNGQILDEKKAEVSKNGTASQSKTDFHVFHYVYMEENIDYQK